MVYYTNCCFCIKSKTGAKAIAITGITICFLILISGSITYGIFYEDLYNIAKYETNGPVTFDDLKIINIAVGASIATLIFAIFLNSMLLYGINTRKPGFMLPSQIFSMLVLLVSLYMYNRLPAFY